MAENIDGALAFKSTLDNVDFDKNIAELERRIRSASNVAVTEGERMESAFKGVGTAIGAYFSFSAIQGFTSQIIKVRSEFQNTEASFRVFLGSAEKAKNFMDEIQGYAFNNVFEFKDLTKVSAQLLAYGHDVNSIIPIIDKLSNVAAGANVPLEQLASLYNKAKSQGKLMTDDIQQWQRAGVPVIQELAKTFNMAEDAMWEMVTTGKIGFNEIDQVITKLTSSGGMFAGMMTEKMKTLGDSVGLLQDSLTAMFNEIGEKNEDFLRSGILAVNSLVENYEDVIRVLKSIAIAYGTYRAAVVLNTLATKNQTGVALIDNTVRKAKIALLKAEAVATGQTAALQAKMTAAEIAHTAALQAKLTVEEQEIILNNLRVAAIQSLLTIEQQQYLTNLNLTTSSEGYVAAAMGVLSVEQKQALNKMDLTRNSQIYAAAITKEVATKQLNKAATLDVMRTEVKAAAVKVASAKEAAIVSMQAVEAARYEVYWAKQSGDATRIQAAEKRQLAAIENQSLARKAALAAQTDFYTKKKTLEAAATRQTAAASAADAASKAGQTTATNLLSVATTKATLAVKTLWTALKTNPLGWILTIVGLVVSAFTMFSKKQEENTDVAKEFEAQIRKETNSIQTLIGVIKSANEGTKVRKEAVEKLNSILGSYNLELLKESATVEEVSKKYDELTKAIKASTAERLKAQGLERISSAKDSNEQKELDSLKKSIGKIRDKEWVSSYSPYGGGGYMKSTIPEWVKTMNDETYEFIASYVSESAEKLQGLTGAEYFKAYSQIKVNTVKLIQAASGGTEADMNKALIPITAFIDSYVKEANVAASASSKLTSQMESMGGVLATPIPTDSIDYMTLSLSELDKKSAELERQINTMKLTPGYDPTELNQLLADLGLVRAAMSDKELNLNTEAGIDRRVKQLKDLKENAEIGSKEYKNLEKQISALENRKPRTSKQQDDVLKKQQEAAQKQLDAALKLEESRIEIMQDGYEKRVAEANFQHKQTIAAINKEQQELEKAYKESGQKMPESEKADFDERRLNAEKSLSIRVNNLFDSELDYKKKQYALYFKWVESVGEATAKEQFKDLLKNGSSYSAYIKAQRDALRKKLNDGVALSEQETNQLITFDAQYNELTGVKSAVDTFKDSISQAVSQASTLAEKLDIIAQKKKELEEGGSGIVGEDEKGAVGVYLSEEEEAINREIQSRILSDFKSFEDQRNSIQKEYALLRKEALVQNNADLLARINEGEAEALSALNASMLMQSESWQNLFGDLDSLTVDAIDKLIRDIQTKMDTADLNLNPADMKAVLDRLDEAKQKILDTNPFKAMGSAIKQVFEDSRKGSKSSSQEIKRNWKNLADATEGSFDFVIDAIDSCSVLGDLIGDSGKEMVNMLQSVAMAGIAMAAAIKTAEKGSVILTAISAALTIVNALFSIFNNDKKKEEKIQRLQEQVDALANAYDRLGRAIDRTYWVDTDEEKAARQARKQAIEDQIKLLEDEENLWLRIANAQKIKDLKAELEKVNLSGDMFEMMDYQAENLKQQQEVIKQQIATEKGKKKTDNSKIKAWEEDIKDLQEQEEELQRKRIEALAGTDVQSAIDEFADALVEAYVKGEDAAVALGEVTKKVMKNAVVEAIKRQFLAKGIQEAVEYLGASMEDGTLTDSERAEFERMVNAAGDATRQALEGVGDWIKDLDDDSSADALTGAVKGVTEETASILAGRINQIVIYQADGLQIMRQSLIYQSETAANTRNIAVTNETLRRIENKLDSNSLLSQGIGG